MATARTYVGRCRRCLAFVTMVEDDLANLEAVAEAVAAMILAGLGVVTLPVDEARFLRDRHRTHDAGCVDSPEAIAERFVKSVAEEHREAMQSAPPVRIWDEAADWKGMTAESREELRRVLERHGAELTSYYPAEADPTGFPVDRSGR